MKTLSAAEMVHVVGGQDRGAVTFMIPGSSSVPSSATSSIANLSGNLTSFAGPKDDAFYVNLAQIFDLGAFAGLNATAEMPFRSKIYDK